MTQYQLPRLCFSRLKLKFSFFILVGYFNNFIVLMLRAAVYVIIVTALSHTRGRETHTLSAFRVQFNNYLIINEREKNF